MQTEFTCGIYTARYPLNAVKWQLLLNERQIALLEEDGSLLHWCEYPPAVSIDMLIEIAVLMNNIKRQYQQQSQT